MNRRAHGVLGLIVFLSLPASSLAQDKGQSGVVVTTPTSVGLIWHASDRVALRPDFSFSRSTVDSGDEIADASTSSYSLGISVLLYLRQWDDLRAYVSPRFSYATATSRIDASNGSQINRSSAAIYGFGGSFDAHYVLGPRFGVFGETGLNIIHQTSETESSFPIADRITKGVAVRSALGVVLYF
jgi:hypothetical protein